MTPRSPQEFLFLVLEFIEELRRNQERVKSLWQNSYYDLICNMITKVDNTGSLNTSELFNEVK